jgi:hypothetical protein
VLVCIFRFDDMRTDCAEVKVRKTCRHGCKEDTGAEEANL